MNKDSIYKIIGYNGEYNQSVKKALKKLLKENHPDNNGNSKIFELICEVKNELENNAVSFIVNENKKNIEKNCDIDYEYCYLMIEELDKEKKELVGSISKKNTLLRKFEEEYKSLYKESVEIETKVLNNSFDFKRMKRIKIISVLMVVILIILFVLSILKNNLVLFIIFSIISLFCIIFISQYFNIINELIKNNKRSLKDYIEVVKEINKVIAKKDKLKKEILTMEKNKKNIENDLRFYNNIIK